MRVALFFLGEIEYFVKLNEADEAPVRQREQGGRLFGAHQILFKVVHRVGVVVARLEFGLFDSLVNAVQIDFVYVVAVVNALCHFH